MDIQYFLRLILTMLVLLLTVGSAGAQDQGPVRRVSYFLSADAAGVQQVYQLLLDGQSEPRQITNAAIDVLTYGAAPDGLSVAYVSGGQLWLRSTHSDAGEALAPVSATQFFGSPVYSQDGQYLAYPDNGVWLLDLSTRQTRQILQDIPFDATASSMDFRMYQPEQFVLGADGRSAQLIVDIGVWEWNTVGVYDLATDELTVLEGQSHTSLLPLYGGRVLLYGNGGMAGEPALHFADTLAEINNSREILRFDSLTSEFLFAEQAVEIRPGVVRVLGSVMSSTPDEAKGFMLDVDLMAGTSSPVTIFTLSRGMMGNVFAGRLSADGSLLPVYRNADYSVSGGMVGEFGLLDILSGQPVAAPVPAVLSRFVWQP